jgi:hypothetical protein
LTHAILDQAAQLFDARGGFTRKDMRDGLSLHAARVAARYRGVRV